MMPLLERNLQKYASVEETLSDRLTFQALDWTSHEHLGQIAHGAPYDLVLCADCIDESERMLPHLVDAICASLDSSGTALVATGYRSQRLMDVFLSALRRRCLVVNEFTERLTPLLATTRRSEDATRFFAVRWPTLEVALQDRARGEVSRLASSDLPMG